MNLKKINPQLQQALIEHGLTEANEMQQETFSTIKSGADAVIQSPGGTGKTTTIINLINAYQEKLDKKHENKNITEKYIKKLKKLLVTPYILYS